jgi:hypothetical protein
VSDIVFDLSYAGSEPGKGVELLEGIPVYLDPLAPPSRVRVVELWCDWEWDGLESLHRERPGVLRQR